MSKDINQLVNEIDPNGRMIIDPICQKLIEVGSSEIETFIKRFTTSEESRIRWNLAYVLGELKSNNAIDVLISALRDQNGLVREQAARALGKIRDKRAVDALMRSLKSDERYDVREIAAWALGEIGDEGAIPALIDAIADEEIEVEDNAIDSLMRLATSDSSLLIDALTRDNEQIQCGAMEVLSHLGISNVQNHLIELLSHHSGRVRNCAVQALKSSTSLELFPHFLICLKDKYDLVRANAASALGELGDRRAIEPLQSLLGDPSERVRVSALQALTSIQDPLSL